MTSRSAETVVSASQSDTGLMLRTGQVMIVVAAVLVGVAIVADGTISRALNGVGALAWVVGAVILVVALRSESRAGFLFGLTAFAAVELALLVRPSDLPGAIAGFGIAGAVVGFAARSRPVAWALLVPGIYLPVHLTVAIGRSLLAGGTSIRTEPPPTAPLVPLAMVLAAAVAGLVVNRIRNRTL
jgi:hypothetical protein